MAASSHVRISLSQSCLLQIEGSQLPPPLVQTCRYKFKLSLDEKLRSDFFVFKTTCSHVSTEDIRTSLGGLETSNEDYSFRRALPGLFKTQAAEPITVTVVCR